MQGVRHAPRNASNLVAGDYRQGPSAEQWLEVQGVVQELYVTEKRPLKEVREILARDYNFRASYEFHSEAVLSLTREANL
jgi:hypothetical protein